MCQFYKHFMLAVPIKLVHFEQAAAMQWMLQLILPLLWFTVIKCIFYSTLFHRCNVNNPPMYDFPIIYATKKILQCVSICKGLFKRQLHHEIVKSTLYKKHHILLLNLNNKWYVCQHWMQAIDWTLANVFEIYLCTAVHLLPQVWIYTAPTYYETLLNKKYRETNDT
jgi:hypothetical protein